MDNEQLGLEKKERMCCSEGQGEVGQFAKQIKISKGLSGILAFHWTLYLLIWSVFAYCMMNGILNRKSLPFVKNAAE